MSKEKEGDSGCLPFVAERVCGECGEAGFELVVGRGERCLGCGHERISRMFYDYRVRLKAGHSSSRVARDQFIRLHGAIEALGFEVEITNTGFDRPIPWPEDGATPLGFFVGGDDILGAEE